MLECNKWVMNVESLADESRRSKYWRSNKEFWNTVSQSFRGGYTSKSKLAKHKLNRIAKKPPLIKVNEEGSKKGSSLSLWELEDLLKQPKYQNTKKNYNKESNMSELVRLRIIETQKPSFCLSTNQNTNWKALSKYSFNKSHGISNKNRRLKKFLYSEDESYSPKFFDEVGSREYFKGSQIHTQSPRSA